MEWFSRRTSIAGIQIPNWMVALAGAPAGGLRPSASKVWSEQAEKGSYPRSPPPRPYLLDHHSAALLSADRALDRARGRCRAMSAALELGNRA